MTTCYWVAKTLPNKASAKDILPKVRFAFEKLDVGIECSELDNGIKVSFLSVDDLKRARNLGLSLKVRYINQKNLYKRDLPETVEFEEVGGHGDSFAFSSSTTSAAPDLSPSGFDFNKFLDQDYLPGQTVVEGVTQFDIHTVVERLSKNKEAYSKVDGKDIILFFGITGAGKSTTLNFLAGRRMKEKEITIESVSNGKRTVFKKTVLDCENPLENCIIGHKPVSETYKVQPFEVQNLVLCDAPGIFCL